MKIAILGYDVEGKSSYEYFAAQGHDITIHDRNPDIVVPDGVRTVLSEDVYLNNLSDYDLLVRTAGLPPRYILEKNPGVAAKITTNVNEFFKACPTKNVIGVTGTKGKGTTSTLITNMLEEAGKNVKLGGNIGVPPLSFINELSEDWWVVLELSSFQLIDIKYSPHIAVCLMVVPEHLNWHADLEEYFQAKQQLFIHQRSEDIAIYFGTSQTSHDIASASQGQKIPYYEQPGAYVDNDVIKIDDQEIIKTIELKLLGKHNLQNVCAAVTAVWQVSQDLEAVRSALATFAGLPHRIEFLRDLDGIRWYNDSYASGLAATIAAIEAVEGKKVMIIGGFDRGLDISPFIDYCMSNQQQFEKLMLIGESAQRLKETLDAAGFTNYVLGNDLKFMPEIVSRAKELAQPGNAIILSPGFASFDMFKNFEDRGLQFKEAVSKL